jgi:hypothetical protein
MTEIIKLVFKRAVRIIVENFNDRYPDDIVLDKVVQRVARATEDDSYFARRVAENVDLDSLAGHIDVDWEGVAGKIEMEELAPYVAERLKEVVIEDILERLPDPLKALIDAKEPVLDVEDNPTLVERVVQRAAEMLLASAENAAAEGLLDNE